MKQIALRFANPRMVQGFFHIDVEGVASEPMELFGINLRFLYDTRLFKPYSPLNTDFKIILEEGYSLSNPFNGNSPTGWAMFGSSGPITYINTAVQLSDTNFALGIGDDPFIWTKILTLQLIPKAPLPLHCCPSFIWDKKTIFDQNNAGGYMGQGDGLTVTESLGVDARGVLRSAPTVEIPNHFNWTPNILATRYPWGAPNSNNCFQP